MISQNRLNTTVMMRQAFLGNAAAAAVTADVLSTAFMIMHPDEINHYCQKTRDVKAIVVWKADPKELTTNVLCWGL